MPYAFDENDLLSLFEGVGLNSIKLLKMAKGWALLTCDTPQAKKRVFNYQGHRVMGRPIRIEEATQEPSEKGARKDRDFSDRDRGVARGDRHRSP